MQTPTFTKTTTKVVATLVGVCCLYLGLAFWPVVTYKQSTVCHFGLNGSGQSDCTTSQRPSPNWLVWQSRPGSRVHFPGPEGQRPNICQYSWWTGEKTCTFDTSKETGDELIGAGYEQHGDQLWDCTTTKNHPEVRTCGLNHTYELYKNMPIPGE